MWSVKYFHDWIVFEFGNITVPVWRDWNSLPLLLHCEGMILTVFPYCVVITDWKKDNGHGCSGIVSIATSLVKGSFSNIIDWNMVATPLPLSCLQKDCPCTLNPSMHWRCICQEPFHWEKITSLMPGKMCFSVNFVISKSHVQKRIFFFTFAYKYPHVSESPVSLHRLWL